MAGYAHLHTTLNKSRDEKLKSPRVGRTNDFGERAGVMGPRRPTQERQTRTALDVQAVIRCLQDDVIIQLKINLATARSKPAASPQSELPSFG